MPISAQFRPCRHLFQLHDLCRIPEPASHVCHLPMDPTIKSMKQVAHTCRSFHQFLGNDWLVLVDTYSIWLDIHMPGSTSTIAPVELLYKTSYLLGIFTHLSGIYNMTIFVSQESQAWFKTGAIVHLTGVPYNLETNMVTEYLLQSYKKFLSKS